MRGTISGTIVNILCKLLCFNIFISIFVKILCIWNIILGLYWVARECGHSQAPVPKLQKEKCEQDQQPLQSAPPLKDEYLVGIQTRQTLVIEDNSSLLTPLTIDEPEWKCKVQPRHALLGYPFHNTAAHTEATPTREGI